MRVRLYMKREFVNLADLPMLAQVVAIHQIIDTTLRPSVMVMASRAAWILCGLTHERLFCHGIDVVIAPEDQ